MAFAPLLRPLLLLGVRTDIGPEDQGAARASRVAVVALVEPLVATQQFSGAVALMRDDRLVYARGFGRASHAPAVAFTPGTASDGGSLAKTFTAAGLVVQRVGGQRYADFVRERFFRPHGLVHSFARPAHFADWPGPRTRGYRFRHGRWQDHDAYDDEAFLGASNLMFSALDLARWGNAWAHGRVLPEAAERGGCICAACTPMRTLRGSPTEGLPPIPTRPVRAPE